jgi:hypothetical protein
MFLVQITLFFNLVIKRLMAPVVRIEPNNPQVFLEKNTVT